MSLERYHYLRAAIRGDFDVTTVPPDFSRAQLFPRQGVLFDRYQPYSLKSVLGIKLHPREDGTVHPEDLALYARGLRESWKCREAEILYCLAEGREFWNMVLNYHSAAATTGYKPWDRLFAALKRNDFDKSIIPCMVSVARVINATRGISSPCSGLRAKLVALPRTVRSNTTKRRVLRTARRSSKSDETVWVDRPPGFLHCASAAPYKSIEQRRDRWSLRQIRSPPTMTHWLLLV